ncbi:MAG: hypothetical protein ACRC18_06830 [Cetobacterium sp.]
MKFVEKNENKVDVKCGDFILYRDKSLDMIIDLGRGSVGLVSINSGYFSYDWEFDSLEELLENIHRDFEGYRFIKSDNIKIEEV